jgi:hypothetical protein
LADEKGEIVSSVDVDENLALQIWTKGGSPRLSVMNRGKDTRKLIRFNWVENPKRKLTMKGRERGKNVEYEMSALDPFLKQILSEYTVYSTFKMFYWPTVTFLMSLAHQPVSVLDASELSMLPETKRSFLWLADYTQSRTNGILRPFFPMSDAERAVLSAPEGFPIPTGEKATAATLAKMGIGRKLAGVNPARWMVPLQITAAAMLLNFSFCGADGSEFSEALWNQKKAPIEPKIDDTRLFGMGACLLFYLRHFEDLQKLRLEIGVYNSVDALQKQEYVRKRRMDVPAKVIGDVDYTVTFFEKEGLPNAFACSPRSVTARHEHDVVYHIPPDILAKIAKDDTMGGVADDLFSLFGIMRSAQFSNWLGRVSYLCSDFVSVGA